MQTFGLTLQFSLSAVITKDFLAESRKEAQAENATTFLKAIQNMYPEDDDQFMLAIVKNAMRTNVRHSTLQFMLRSGVGGNVSPVQIVSEEIAQKASDIVGFAEQTEGGGAVIEAPSKALQLPAAEAQLLIGHEG
jgi:hypothetical protein